MAEYPLYSLRNVQKSYRNNADFLLEISHLDILAGQKLAFIGPSGCGKSTALDILAGILRPDRAERFMFRPPGGDRVGYDMMRLWEEGRRNEISFLRLHSVGYVLQTGGLLPFLTVKENIMIGRRALGLSAGGDDKLVDELVALLELGGLLRALPSRLSVGERQRVAIARAVASRPALILADEPTAALDPPKARVVMELFCRITSQLACAVVMVTHAPDMAAQHGFQLLPLQVQCQDGLTTARLKGAAA